MAKSKRFRGQSCVYCGEESEEPDHIPPQSLFGESSRQGLIQVPSCKNCNHQAHKDDEYFKTVLAIMENTERHPDVR